LQRAIAPPRVEERGTIRYGGIEIGNIGVTVPIPVRNAQRAEADRTDDGLADREAAPGQRAQDLNSPVVRGRVTYRAADASTTGNPATVRITVQRANQLPVAANDTAATSEETPVVVDILQNDHDIDGTLDPASVVFTGLPAHGTVAANAATGAVTYTPDPVFFGADSFRYKVGDNSGALSNEATVSITVQQRNHAPEAVRDTYVLNEDTQLVVAAAQGVLANDTDAEEMRSAHRSSRERALLTPSRRRSCSRQATRTATALPSTISGAPAPRAGIGCSTALHCRTVRIILSPPRSSRK
jgi:hypothetical protein